MDSINEISPNGYVFSVGAKPKVIDGKAHWRDCINVNMDRHDALELLSNIATALKNPKKTIFVSWCGWLEKEERGSWATTTEPHNCSTSEYLDLEEDAYGPAITKCVEDKSGKLWVDNGEYASQVNYCPMCGYKAKVRVYPERSKECS